MFGCGVFPGGSSFVTSALISAPDRSPSSVDKLDALISSFARSVSERRSKVPSPDTRPLVTAFEKCRGSFPEISSHPLTAVPAKPSIESGSFPSACTVTLLLPLKTVLPSVAHPLFTSSRTFALSITAPPACTVPTSVVITPVQLEGVFGSPVRLMLASSTLPTAGVLTPKYSDTFVSDKLCTLDPISAIALLTLFLCLPGVPAPAAKTRVSTKDIPHHLHPVDPLCPLRSVQLQLLNDDLRIDFQPAQDQVPVRIRARRLEVVPGPHLRHLQQPDVKRSRLHRVQE